MAAPWGMPSLARRMGFLCSSSWGSGSRLLRPPDRVTDELGVRLLVVERPGIGLSSFHPQRTLLDWPDDVAQFADVLELERFAVIGASGAGPYAAACASRLAHRLTSVSIVSSPAPYDIPHIMDGMPRAIRLVPQIAQRLPALLVWSQLLTAPLARRSPAWMMRQAFRKLPQADQQVFHNQPTLEALFSTNVQELYRQGGHGMAQELLLVSLPWGFDVADIRARVSIWHGDQDANIPPAMGYYLAQTIPDAQATFVPEAGHFLTFSHWHQILTQAVS
jgi:pimeloyl-ACP methyl ester carboxylesterase